MPEHHLSPDVTQAAVEQPIRLSEIISALSFALDLTEGAAPGHALRSCLLGMRIAQEIDLPHEDCAGLYYALLLKDIGCSSNAPRLCQAFAADERTVKHRFKLMDRQKLGRPNREALSFVWNNVAPGTGAWNRVRQIARMLRSDGDLAAEMIETRCDRGGIILRKFGMNEATCTAVYAIDEHWNGRGLPRHLAASDIPLLARICAVAQHLDVYCSEHGPARAIDSLVERSSLWFDPELVHAAQVLHFEQDLWTGCLPDDDLTSLRSAVMSFDPGSTAALAGHDIDLICSGFADVVDAKSSFTFRHSVGVAHAAVLMAETMGFTSDRVTTMRRVGLLHDIGKLGVPNTILDKAGRPSQEEWAILQRHPGLSREILSRVNAFSDIALLAGQHLEKLDGTGYPHGLSAPELSLESRMLTVADMFSALIETRPYRPDLSPAEVQSILAREVPQRLDGDCFEALLSVMEQFTATLPAADPAICWSSPPVFHATTACA